MKSNARVLDEIWGNDFFYYSTLSTKFRLSEYTLDPKYDGLFDIYASQVLIKVKVQIPPPQLPEIGHTIGLEALQFQRFKKGKLHSDKVDRAHF